MKKAISIIMMVILLIALMGMNVVNAASCTVSLSASNTAPTVGKDISVTINFSTGVVVSDLYLNYNSSVLEYRGSSAPYASNSNGVVTLNYIDLSGKTTRSLTVNFRVKAAGTSNCTVSGGDLADSQGTPLTTSIGGGVTINAKASNSNTGGSGSNSGSSSNSNSGGSTTKKPSFSSTNQKVYATSQVNIRESWSTSSKQLGTLQKGDSITRTGIGDNGWSRVSYNGKVAYINSQYLTTTKPKEENKDKNDNKNNTTNETSNNTTNETANNEVNNTVNDITNNTENNQENNLINNEQQGSNEVKNEKKDSKSYVEFIIIGIIIVAILVIIISEILEKKRKEKRNRKHKK